MRMVVILMISLKDVAEFANVSISTVSRVLNDKGNISRETREKVLKIVEELIYKPGTVLQNYNGNPYTIGIYVPKSNDFINDDPSSSIDINTLREELEKLGNKVIITTNNGKVDIGTIAYQLIEKKEINGAIICDPFKDDEYINEFIKHDVPYIITNGIFLDRDCNYVDYNHFDGACQAMDYLCSLGHKNIAIISGPSDHMVSLNRIRGCKKTLEEHGLQYIQDKVYYCPFNLNSAYEAARALLEKHGDITAIFAFSDILALGAIKAAREKGKNIPDDISIVGFDDTALSQYVDPPLTTVKRFRYDISHLIARSIGDLINNKNIEKINISLKTELVIRESCKKIL
jgi:Transcriptional regulators